MKYSQAKQGRIFVIRLEDGDIVHEEIEKFSRKESIKAAALIIIGGADKGSKLVVWHIMEVILFELTESSGIRTFESQTGLKLL